MYRVRQEDLPFKGSSHHFVGADTGDVGVSVFLFNGEPGRGPSVGYVLKSLTQGCVPREFSNWALNRTSPIIARSAPSAIRCSAPPRN